VRVVSNMKARSVKKAIAVVFPFLIFASLILAPAAKALSFNYSDNLLGYFSVTCSSDIAQPESVITANITGRLSSTTAASQVVFHITYTVDTTSQLSKILNEQDMVIDSKTILKNSLSQIVIPSNAVNNAYVFAAVTNNSIVFAKIPIALVQNPTYLVLQSQVSNLNSSLINLLSNYTSLLSSYSNIQSLLAVVLANYEKLQNTSADFQVSNSSIQNQLVGLQTEKKTLQIQIISLQNSSSALQTELTAIQTEKTELLDKKADLQKQLSSLQLNSTDLQTLVYSLNDQMTVLQLRLVNMQSESNTASILIYVATFAALAFIIATAYFVRLLVKRKGTKKEKTSLTG